MSIAYPYKKPTEVQTVVLFRDYFPTFREAEAWIVDHGFDLVTAEETDTQYRFRQAPVSDFHPGSFRTIEVRPGVQLIIGKRIGD